MFNKAFFNTDNKNQEEIDDTYSQAQILESLGIDTDGDNSQFELSKLHSAYWIDTLPHHSTDLISLAAYRRAIARFVWINAGRRDIKVLFNVQDQSATDGDRTVWLSAQIKNKEFDAVVGLALHESNHIFETDFEVKKRLADSTRKDKIKLPTSMNKEMKRLGKTEQEVRTILDSYRNFIEDRRIDTNGYRRSPGYQPYYIATYKKYFLKPIISLGLKSSSHRELDLDSYNFRILGLMHPDSDIDALPELDKINKIIDFRNIDRLSSNLDSAYIAIKVVNIILKNLPDPEENEGQGQGENQDENQNETQSQQGQGQGQGEGKGQQGQGQGDQDQNLPDDMVDQDLSNGSQVKDDKDDHENKEGKGDENKNESKENENQGEGEDKVKLTKLQLNKLKKALQALNNSINGETRKVSISNEDKQKLDAIDKSGSTIEHVDGDHLSGTDVLVVRSLNEEILKSLCIGNTGWDCDELIKHNDSVEGIRKGIILGKLLARKLQLRNETKTLTYKRKTSGKMDKRLLHSVGFGSTSIFEKIKKDSFGDALAHISIDASGSMDGSEWLETMTATVGIAYAASLIENLDIIISFRSTEDVGASMIIAYDSRKDNFIKIKKLFKYIRPDGITPEGLCYEATMKDILASTAGKIGYFINFSDGAPNMSTALRSPVELTKDAVTKMRGNGIKILSFLIGGCGEQKFKQMYGKDGRSINVTSIVPLAKELNKMFSTKI